MSSPRARRRVWWTKSQAMNWVLLREEASVAADLPDYDATLRELRREGKFKGQPPSVGLLTCIDIGQARPYLKPGLSLIASGNGAEAEKAFNQAVAAGRIRTTKDGLLRAEDVRREFPFPAKPGRKHGKASQRHFNTEALERLASHIRNNPRPPRGDLTALHYTLSKKLQLPAMAKDVFPAFVRCAIGAADNQVRNKSGERDTPEEWNLGPAELQRQQRNINTWQIRRGRPKGSRG
jgi:hypothetical protein